MPATCIRQSQSVITTPTTPNRPTAVPTPVIPEFIESGGKTKRLESYLKREKTRLDIMLIHFI